MSRSIIIAASVLALGLASTGCAVDASSEEEAPAEQAGAVSQSESEDEELTEEERSLATPIHPYVLPPDVDRHKEVQGPFPQPWTPDDK